MAGWAPGSRDSGAVQCADVRSGELLGPDLWEGGEGSGTGRGRSWAVMLMAR